MFFGGLGDRVVRAPSVLSADFAYLADEVRKAGEGGAHLEDCVGPGYEVRAGECARVGALVPRAG